MTAYQPRLALEAKLKTIDERLAAKPENAAGEADIELRFQRANTLHALGRTIEARAAYLELLTIASSHFGALNNLGTLLYETGFQTLARSAYTEAIKYHPKNPTGYINLANALLTNGEVDAARRNYEEALRLKPDNVEAHQGLSCLYAETGDEVNAQRHRNLGYARRPVMTYPYRGTQEPIRVLVLASTMGGTVPIRHHLDEHTFSTTVVFVDCYDCQRPLPPHDLVFNAMGDADLCRPSLEAAAKLLHQSTAPLINAPAAVLTTGRAANAARLARLSGVIAPQIALLPRDLLQQPDSPALLAQRGFSFPLLLRSPGFHTGRYFQQVSLAAELNDAVSSLPGAELMVLEYLDARAADGKVRKYRVMMIDGQFFPLHAAVSRDWKVHYFSADMVETPAHRDEDEAFLNHMPEILGARGLAALEQIHAALGLEYAGVDFSLSASGEVLLFEANATMVVHPPDADSRWDYRRAPVQRILDAVREMFVRRARAEGGNRE